MERTRALTAMALGFAALLLSTGARGQANECRIGGVGRACTSDTACANQAAPADACVFSPDTRSYGCQIPCEKPAQGGAAGAIEPDWDQCSYGELCVPAVDRGGAERFICKPVGFTVDLNL